MNNADPKSCVTINVDPPYQPGRQRRLAILLAGAAFVLIPSSEAIHASLRAALGIGGVECC